MFHVMNTTVGKPRSSEKTGDTGISSLLFSSKMLSCYNALDCCDVQWRTQGSVISTVCLRTAPCKLHQGDALDLGGLHLYKRQRTGEEKDCTPKQKEWNKIEHILKIFPLPLWSSSVPLFSSPPSSYLKLVAASFNRRSQIFLYDQKPADTARWNSNKIEEKR